MAGSNGYSTLEEVTGSSTTPPNTTVVGTSGPSEPTVDPELDRDARIVADRENVLQIKHKEQQIFDKSKISNTELYNHEGNGRLNFDVPYWGVKDFINERNFWLKGTNLTHGNEPGWFYFKVFFKFNTSYGLFGGIFSTGSMEVSSQESPSFFSKLKKEIVGNITGDLGLGSKKTEEIDGDYASIVNFPGVNCATQYLSSLADVGNYDSLKLNERLLALHKFASLLFELSIKTPWSIKGISNLQQAFDVTLNNFSDEKSFDLLFNTETVDMRLANLLDLYKYACYDDINCKEILPENLRKFDVSIIIFHMPLKYIHTGISVLKFGDTEKKFNMLDNICTVANKQLGQYGFINTGVNVVQGIADVWKAFTTKSLLFDYKHLYVDNNDFSNTMSYKMLTFSNCEIDVSSFGKYVENVDMKNESPFQFGNTALKIKYDKVYYHNMNEWNQYMFGSDGFYYNEHVPNRLIPTNAQEKSTSTYANLYKNRSSKKRWENRIEALSNVSEAGNYNSQLSDSQWKNLLDYSEIAVTGSLKDFDMEDLIMPEKAIKYNTKTGNLYNNFTKVSSGSSLIKSGIFSKSKYFQDKITQMTNTCMIGNLFGSLCNEISNDNYGESLSSQITKFTKNLVKNIPGSNINGLNDGHVSKYYDFKLSRLATSNTARNESTITKLVNDALTTFNKVTGKETLLLPDTSLVNMLLNKSSGNLYGNYGPKHVLSYNLYIQNDDIKKQMSSWNYEEYTSYISSTNINYFDIKMNQFLHSNLSGNIHENNPVSYTNSYGTMLTDYFANKMKYLSKTTYEGIDKISGNIYGVNFTAYGSLGAELRRKYTDYFKNKFETLSASSNFGNIHDYDVSVFSYYEGGVHTRKTTERFNYKMEKLIHNDLSNSNIYDHDMIAYTTLFNNETKRTRTEYLIRKIESLRNSYNVFNHFDTIFDSPALINTAHKNNFDEFKVMEYVDNIDKLTYNKNDYAESLITTDTKIINVAENETEKGKFGIKHDNSTYVLNMASDTYTNNINYSDINGLITTELQKHNNTTTNFNELVLQDNIIKKYFDDSLTRINIKQYYNHFNTPMEWAQQNLFTSLMGSSNTGNIVGAFL